MIAVSILCILTLLLEEFFLRRSGLGSGTPVWLAGADPSPMAAERGHRLSVRYRIIKLTQFAAFALLWVLASGRAGKALLTCSFGQVATQLLLMQGIRAVGRKVLRNRTFLGLMSVQQGLLAIAAPILMMVMPRIPETVRPAAFVSGLGISLSLLSLGVAFSAAAVYFVRLSPLGENQSLSDLPPLFDSEALVRKATLLSLPCLSMAALPLMIDPSAPLPALAAVIATSAAVLSACILFLGRKRFHHPTADAVAALSYILLLLAVLTGVTDFRA